MRAWDGLMRRFSLVQGGLGGQGANANIAAALWFWCRRRGAARIESGDPDDEMERYAHLGIAGPLPLPDATG